MSHTKNKSGSPRFQVGNKVRVKYGVIVPRLSRHPFGRLVGYRHQDHQSSCFADLKADRKRASR